MYTSPPSGRENPRDRQQRTRSAKSSEATLERLRGNDPPYIPQLTKPFTVGDIGVWDKPMKVDQVVSSSVGRVSLGGDDVLLKGINFSGIADGDSVNYQKSLIVEGTHTYKTVLGGTRTVMVLAPSKAEDHMEQ